MTKRYSYGCVIYDWNGNPQWGDTVAARDYDALAAENERLRGLLREMFSNVVWPSPKPKTPDPLYELCERVAAELTSTTPGTPAA